MNHYFFHPAQNKEELAQRRRAATKRYPTFWCEECERDVCVTLRSKIQLNVCKHCSGELKYS